MIAWCEAIWVARQVLLLLGCRDIRATTGVDPLISGRTSFENDAKNGMFGGEADLGAAGAQSGGIHRGMLECRCF